AQRDVCLLAFTISRRDDYHRRSWKRSTRIVQITGDALAQSVSEFDRLRREDAGGRQWLKLIGCEEQLTDDSRNEALALGIVKKKANSNLHSGGRIGRLVVP